jgi:hypothetical protein
MLFIVNLELPKKVEIGWKLREMGKGGGKSIIPPIG